MTSERLYEFGLRVVARRRALGLTMTQLADRAEVSRGYMSRVESQECVPTLPVAQRIAEALGSSVDDLLGEAAT